MQRWLMGLIIFFSSSLAWADATRILIIHSYSQEYSWTKQQHKGFVDALEAAHPDDVVFSVEYLDTKRIPLTEHYKNALIRQLQVKYSDYQPDLIYVTDDDALRFTRHYLRTLFPATPVIFSGVNDYSVLEELHREPVTGVFEKKSVLPNIQLLRDSGVTLDSIAFVGDGSSTYTAIEQEIIKELRSREIHQPLFIESSNIQEVLHLLGSIQVDAVVLTTIGGMQDSAGNTIPVRESIPRIVNAGNYNVISMEDAYMLPGVLGGWVTSSRRQGQVAAELATDILAGHPVSNVSPVRESPNIYMFNHAQLIKHSIKLPEDIEQQALILNRPASLYEIYRRTIVVGMFVLAGMMLVILAIGLWLLSRKNRLIRGNISELNQQRLVMEEIKGSLQEAQHIAKMGNWDWNIKEDTLYWSDGIYKLFGESPNAFEASYENFLERVHPEDRKLVEESVRLALRNKEPYEVEHRILLPDGTVRTVFETGNVVFADDNQTPIRMIGTVRDVTGEREAERKLIELATYDTLTGLPNRNTLFDRVGQAIRRAQRHGQKAALLFLDLDRFKHINDSLGHQIGDQLLIEAAQRLRRLVRDEDTVARLGGDEFVVLLEGINEPRDAALVADKIIDMFHEQFKVDDYELHVTTSVGITLYPDDGDDEITLLRNADAAMYHAKDTGRNSYSFYTEEITRQVAERVSMEHRMREGLLHDRFSMHYQPIVNLNTGRIIGMEALMRWYDEQLGQVSPARFIPIAEDSGIIFALGAWMFRDVCRQLAGWLEQGLISDEMQINVNISGIQLMQGGFVDELITTLDEMNVPASMLVIELTETVFFENRELAASILTRLVERGMRVAIDDFGTGYSSLSYLKEMPVDTIKIDQSFVRDIAVDENDRAITRAVTLLGKSLGLKVVAEGVETVEQRKFLLEQGCSLAQGYYFYHPLPVPELTALLQQQT